MNELLTLAKENNIMLKYICKNILENKDEDLKGFVLNILANRW